MPRALLIFNPNAGRYSPVEAARTAAGVLRERGWDIDIRATRSAEDVTDLALQAAAEGLEALIVAGGDGSIGRSVRGLIGSRTSLAILPTGTTNVLAQELGLPRIGVGGLEALLENVRLIAESRMVHIDVGFCDGEPFLLWTGFGLDALVVRRAEQNRSRLKKHFVLPEYLLRTVSTAGRWPGAEIEVRGMRGDGATRVEFRGRAQLAVATNIRRYAGGYALLSPQAAIDDGEMDLWIFRGRGVRTALRHARNLLGGYHVNDAETIRLPFKQITIESDRPAALHRDGEPVPEGQRFEILVRHRALQILAPPTWPAPDPA